ncbi:hypothetical protein ScKU71_10000, partial [Streptococcus canis]
IITLIKKKPQKKMLDVKQTMSAN